MLSKEAQKRLLKALGYADDKVTEIVDTTDEKDATVPEGTKIYSAADFTEALDNNFNSRSKGLREIFVKDLKAKAGLEFEGKTEEKFIEEYKKAVLKEAGQSVDEKVTAKEQKITQMQAALEAKDSEIQKLTGDVSASKKDTLLLRSFPKNRDSKLSDDDYLTLLKSRAELKEEDGKTVVYANGQPLQDDKFNPLPVDAAVAKVFETNNWLGTPADPNNTGKEAFGGKDSEKTPGVFATLSDVKKHIEAQGHNINGQEANKIIDQALAANPNLVLE